MLISNLICFKVYIFEGLVNIVVITLPCTKLVLSAPTV